MAVGFRFMKSAVICKHGLEEAGQFVVNEFVPELQTLHTISINGITIYKEIPPK